MLDIGPPIPQTYPSTQNRNVTKSQEHDQMLRNNKLMIITFYLSTANPLQGELQQHSNVIVQVLVDVPQEERRDDCCSSPCNRDKIQDGEAMLVHLMSSRND